MSKFFHQVEPGDRIRFPKEPHVWVKTGPNSARLEFATRECYVSGHSTVVPVYSTTPAAAGTAAPTFIPLDEQPLRLTLADKLFILAVLVAVALAIDVLVQGKDSLAGLTYLLLRDLVWAAFG